MRVDTQIRVLCQAKIYKKKKGNGLFSFNIEKNAPRLTKPSIECPWTRPKPFSVNIGTNVSAHFFSE